MVEKEKEVSRGLLCTAEVSFWLTRIEAKNDLHTTTSGTPFPGYWTTTLNNWTGASWTAVWGPSQDTLWNATTSDVNNNWPLIYDTHMNSTNGYLPGYSSGEIYHYVTGDGWFVDDYDFKQVHYVDPNRYRSGAFGPHWVTLEQMWKVVRDRGIVW